MMSNVTFELPNYSLEQIKNDYYLYDLCVNDTAQLENIAITIQSLYFYHNILIAANYPKAIESSLCRTIIIMSYSILEAVVVSVGYKIQNRCQYCRHACAYYSNSMFNDKKTHNNEMRAFQNAHEYLRKFGIINLTAQARAYYDDFRDNRNNVHLARNSEVISRDHAYTRQECNSAIEFLQSIIELIHNNFLEFCQTYGCFGG